MPQREPQAEDDVDQVDDDGDVHWEARVLHTDVPSLESEQRDGGRGRPDACEKIFGRIAHRVRRAVHHHQRQPAGWTLQDQQRHRCRQRDRKSPYQNGGDFAEIVRAVGLCRQAAGSHSQESQVPVYEVENGRPDGDSADQRVVAEVTDDGHVDHAQQRDRDVGDDVRNGQREDFTVHTAKVRLFCILSAAFRPFRS